MAFSFGYSPWLLGLSLLLAGALTYWSYRTTVPSLPIGRRVLLGTLRFTSLALICFLLLEPVVRTVTETEQPPVLAVLIDDSESMRVVNGDTDTTAQAVRDRLRNAIEPLRDDLPGTARFFRFDDALHSVSGAVLDSLFFEGRRSDVGGALQAAPDALQGENLKAIALLSDGQYNTGENPARRADRLSVPVHTVTVGDTTQRRDLQVRRLVTNDRAYVDTEVPVRVTLGAEDVGGTTTTLSLLRNDTVLDTAEVPLPSGTAEQAIDLSFVPETAGLTQLTVRASPVPNEATTQNNTRTVSIRVLESERRVLLLGAAPSPNFTALRRVLKRDANTTVTARIPQADGSFYGGPLPDSLDQFDVVVSAGFPSSAVPDEATQRIATLLENGTPALFALDRQTDVAAWTNHFAEALPTTPPDEASTGFTEASVSPVASEQNHPIFQIDGADVDLIERLPPLSVPSSAWTPSPDARVLAEAARPSLSRSDPVLVVRQRAGQRTAALLATGTWRWATLASDLSAADPLWPGLVSNLVRWVTTETDDRQVRVRPVTTTFEGDAPVELTGQVYDESMTPVSDARVSVTVTDSAGTEYPHTMEPLGNGRYELDVGSLPEGTYRYEATARRDDASLGSDRGDFSVGALRLEYQDTRADPTLMRRIAARSGGTDYTSDTAPQLVSDLQNSSSFSPTTTTRSTEAELWRTSLFLILILLLLAAEWTLRKRFGLT